MGNAALGTYTSSELYGKRVVLEYRPATEEDGERIRQAGGIFRAAADQVQMVPVLKIDGQVMAEGEAVYLGSSENMRMDVFSGNTSYSSDNRVTAGSVYQFSLDTQSITPAELEKARLDAEAVKDRVDTDTVYSDEYLGALLKYAGTMYFAQIDVVNRLLAEADEIVSVRDLSVGITEYKVQSIRALGRVVGIQEGSLCIDVVMDVHSRTTGNLIPNPETGAGEYMEVLNTFTAEEVNAELKAINYFEPPYKSNTLVKELQLIKKSMFVRVYNKVNSKMKGPWIMKANDVAGLTPKEIQNERSIN